MRCFLVLAASAALSGLAGFGVAEAATTYGYSPLFYLAAGLIGGCMAGAAVCLSAKPASVQYVDSIPIAKLPKVIGLLGTLAVCAAVLMAHLSPGELKHVAVVIWIFGLLVQTVALLMALMERRAALASERPPLADRQKPHGA
jgi:hypothetical protein